MKIAIVAAEAAPYAKAGGLADVIGALPGALKAIGEEPSLIVPGYNSILSKIDARPIAPAMSVQVGADTETFSVLRGADPHGVAMYLIDHPGYFARDGIYGEKGRDYPDNLKRFVFFGKAAAATADRFIEPDVLHAHDWHAAVAPIVIRADAALRAKFARTLSIFTVHNLAFQGICERADFELLNLAPTYFSIDFLEFYGRVNLMKGALVLSDGSSTVSPTYAREVTRDAELGFGLEGVLRAMGDRFVGIINGADYNEWDPAKDADIAATFTPQRPEGKRACARALRDQLKLPHHEDWPIVGMVTRMTGQKGVDLIRDALPEIMRMDLQIVMLASGDPALEGFFRNAERTYPDRLRVVLEFNNAMAHRIQAGSDAFLMPSRFEPCGLTQMYALHYGSAPVVRATGGLRDTVTEFDSVKGTGDGFVFEKFAVDDLVAALGRMVATYRKPAAWRRLMATAFAADFSWETAARNYVAWFSKLRRASGLN